MTTSRNPVWIEMDKHSRIFSWLHLPATLTHNHAFIIIGAIGPEYMHTYRSIRLLADRLTATGCLVARYDPVGMGNSSENLEDPGIWEKWLSTPSAIRNHIQNNFDIEHYTIIAFRSGSLVLESYLKEYSDDAVVFWYPYTRGAAFIRDMKILDGITRQKEVDNTTIEAGGYPLTQELQTSLQKVNLLTETFAHYKDVLVIENGELTTKSHLSSQIKKTAANTETMFLHGLSALARQAALSVVPVDNIDSIYKWATNLTLHSSDARVLPHSSNTYVSETFTEEAILIKTPNSVFGILTRPANKEGTSRLMIISNSGSGHHAGPNQFHVQTARRLAGEGIATFRMDLSNLGDSPDVYQQDNYHPYPDFAATDLCAILDYFTTTVPFKNIILAGLCSAAHNAFHASIKTNIKALRGLILINIITFYWKTGQSIIAPEENELEINAIEYQSNMFNPKKWIGIILSPSKFPRLAGFAVRLVYKKSGLLITKLLSLFGYQKNTILDDDINCILSKNIKLHFLYSENEPTYKILMSQAGSTVPGHIKDGSIFTHKISCTDHTFSTRNTKQELIKSIVFSVKELFK